MLTQYYYLINTVTNRIRQLMLPNDLATVLSLNQGMNNAILQLIDVKRDDLEGIINT